jgi:hypothetical protein
MTIKEITENAKQIRDRLRHPPNAVHDTGIDLTKKSSSHRGDEPNPDPPIKKMLEMLPEPPRKRYQFAPSRKCLIFDDILEAVSTHYGVSIEAIRGPSRRTHTGFARFVVVHLAIKLSKKPSLSAIGRNLNKDHTSILHARNRIKAIIASNAQVAAEVKMLETYLERLHHYRSSIPSERQFYLEG